MASQIDYSIVFEAQPTARELCSGNLYYLNNEILRVKKQAKNGLFFVEGL